MMSQSLKETVKTACALFEWQETKKVWCFTSEALTQNSPLRQAVSDTVHTLSESMDTDSAYEFVFEALEFLRDNEPKDWEDGHEFADQVDVYTSDLTAWLNRSNKNPNYLTEAVETMGSDSGDKILMTAQYLARLEAYTAVISMLEKWNA